MQKNVNFYNISIFIIFSLYIVITGTYSAYTPAFVGHDESSHYENIHDIADGTKPINYVSKQPLYYVINVK